MQEKYEVKKKIEDALLFDCNSIDYSSLIWFLALKIMPRS